LAANPSMFVRGAGRLIEPVRTPNWTSVVPLSAVPNSPRWTVPVGVPSAIVPP
jgi:hypothetical protein